MSAIPAAQSPEDVPENATLHSDARGKIWVWEGAPGVMRTALRGHLSLGLAEQMIGSIERLSTGSSFSVLHDWSGYTGHDSTARSRTTSWAFDSRARIRALHILLPPPSKVLGMAIAVSNMVLGGSMRIHHDRAAFQAVLRAHAGRVSR